MNREGRYQTRPLQFVYKYNKMDMECKADQHKLMENCSRSRSTGPLFFSFFFFCCWGVDDV